ncbi:RNA polymerase sigma factor [Paenibacillus sp. S-12]|uniref:RNA polymerase sigma factor n=1 Tax=unclassified Paenibacillus TaxID=185978 RepID=UPI0025A17980|nr:RNA polymerase sigma factor [Paenibacillus sp. S-12]
MTNPDQIQSTEQPNLEQLNNVLNRYCLSLTHSKWDSEDLVQDTWVKILTRNKEIEHNNPEALLLRTARNAWIDQVRRRHRFDQILMKQQLQSQEHNDSIQKNSTIDIEAAFQYMMTHLSPLQRTVLLMRSVLGYSVADTANKLKTTEGAVKAAYHRARKMLHDVKEDEYMEEAILPDNPEARSHIRALTIAFVNGEVNEVLRLVQGEQDLVPVLNMYAMSNQMRYKQKQRAYNQMFQHFEAVLAA